ncbi:hypothetical protein STCU_11544 [Strigomonas culicis]|uniref:Uncharacterized protein n=1 Tax=Strigomonas culicis TaxID=28005 RepID=S9UN83_9TRYP|nr:hypothetical protein STCU_11544 [Strigomonas culicis]|eukprot:EPY16116.1 hypothetical protein STCU_11544 [Strigomonas culicis]
MFSSFLVTWVIITVFFCFFLVFSFFQIVKLTVFFFFRMRYSHALDVVSLLLSVYRALPTEYLSGNRMRSHSHDAANEVM